MNSSSKNTKFAVAALIIVLKCATAHARKQSVFVKSRTFYKKTKKKPRALEWKLYHHGNTQICYPLVQMDEIWESFQASYKRRARVIFCFDAALSESDDLRRWQAGRQGWQVSRVAFRYDFNRTANISGSRIQFENGSPPPNRLSMCMCSVRRVSWENGKLILKGADGNSCFQVRVLNWYMVIEENDL